VGEIEIDWTNTPNYKSTYEKPKEYDSISFGMAFQKENSTEGQKESAFPSPLSCHQNHGF
jgi:hypothetical protein